MTGNRIKRKAKIRMTKIVWLDKKLLNKNWPWCSNSFISTCKISISKISFRVRLSLWTKLSKPWCTWLWTDLMQNNSQILITLKILESKVKSGLNLLRRWKMGEIMINVWSFSSKYKLCSFWNLKNIWIGLTKNSILLFMLSTKTRLMRTYLQNLMKAKTPNKWKLVLHRKKMVKLNKL